METKGNNSTAVMQRRLEPKDSFDDFPTPPWATRALIEYVIGREQVKDQTCWEPAANRGYMSRALQEYFQYVIESDIVDYGDRIGSSFDFLSAKLDLADPPVHWIITNPPFNKAEQFIKKAQEIATCGVAMLVRTSFLEGVKRHTTLFRGNNPDIVAQFSERVPMIKGRYDPKATTATSYAWLVWYKESEKILFKKTELVWIPPCRKQLERAEDVNLS